MTFYGLTDRLGEFIQLTAFFSNRCWLCGDTNYISSKDSPGCSSRSMISARRKWTPHPPLEEALGVAEHQYVRKAEGPADSWGMAEQHLQTLYVLLGHNYHPPRVMYTHKQGNPECNQDMMTSASY